MADLNDYERAKRGWASFIGESSQTDESGQDDDSWKKEPEQDDNVSKDNTSQDDDSWYISLTQNDNGRDEETNYENNYWEKPIKQASVDFSYQNKRPGYYSNQIGPYSDFPTKNDWLENDSLTIRSETDLRKRDGNLSDSRFGSGEEWNPVLEPSVTEDSESESKKPIIREPETDTMITERDINEVKTEKKSSYEKSPDIGIVSGFCYLTKDQVPGGFERWMRSFFSGVPYVRDQAGCSFILKPDEYGIGGSSQVVIYGNITSGQPINGMQMMIVGKRLSSGVLLATDGRLMTDPPVEMTIKNQISAGIVRFLTLLVVACLVFLGWLICSVISYITANSDAIITVMVEIIIYIGLLYFIYRWIRSLFRR